MKTRILIPALLFIAQLGFAQELTQTQKLASLCKVWGFLKYYHPEVAKGKWDWDSVLLKKIPLVEATHNKEELSMVYTDWINELGNIDHYKNHAIPASATPKNTILEWQHDNSLFTAEAQALFQKVAIKRATGTTYYTGRNWVGQAEPKHEHAYANQTFPEKPIRLLALYRFWNFIEYYFPYKYLTNQKWDAVLDEMIPSFCESNDELSYQLNVAKLVAKINDSHAYFIPRQLKRTKYRYFAPFETKIIDSKAVVINTFDSVAKLCDIRKGDAILSINDTSIADHIPFYKNYFSASNESVTLRIAGGLLRGGYTDSPIIYYERQGTVYNKKIARYWYYPYTEEKKPQKYAQLGDNIGYINMGQLRNKHIHKMYKTLRESKGLIIDIRNYPNQTLDMLCSKLSKERKKYAFFTQPDFSCPGIYKKSNDYKCGRKNKRYYKGQIAVLMNEETQSQAEFTCMALKSLPNTTLIGSQTAGADGDVTSIILPGNFKIKITGLGVYYPDGGETQRIGIVPDIEVKPTIKGIQEGRDEVLERAIAFINTGK